MNTPTKIYKNPRPKSGEPVKHRVTLNLYSRYARTLQIILDRAVAENEFEAETLTSAKTKLANQLALCRPEEVVA